MVSTSHSAHLCFGKSCPRAQKAQSKGWPSTLRKSGIGGILANRCLYNIVAIKGQIHVHTTSIQVHGGGFRAEVILFVFDEYICRHDILIAYGLSYQY